MTANRDLVVLGAGGHAAVVIDLARAAGFNVIGCLSPTTPSFGPEFADHLGGDDVLSTMDSGHVVLALGIADIGTAALRRRLTEHARALGFASPALVHPAATVATTAAIADGAQVMARAVVQPFASIGAHAIVNTGAIVEHHCRVGDFAHIAPGALLCGGVKVDEDAHVGAHATVRQNLSIGKDAVVGIGAAVVRSVLPRARVVGVPARPL